MTIYMKDMCTKATFSMFSMKRLALYILGATVHVCLISPIYLGADFGLSSFTIFISEPFVPLLTIFNVFVHITNMRRILLN